MKMHFTINGIEYESIDEGTVTIDDIHIEVDATPDDIASLMSRIQSNEPHTVEINTPFGSSKQLSPLIQMIREQVKRQEAKKGQRAAEDSKESKFSKTPVQFDETKYPYPISFDTLEKMGIKVMPLQEFLKNESNCDGNCSECEKDPGNVTHTNSKFAQLIKEDIAILNLENAQLYSMVYSTFYADVIKNKKFFKDKLTYPQFIDIFNSIVNGEYGYRYYEILHSAVQALKEYEEMKARSSK